MAPEVTIRWGCHLQNIRKTVYVTLRASGSGSLAATDHKGSLTTRARIAVPPRSLLLTYPLSDPPWHEKDVTNSDHCPVRYVIATPQDCMSVRVNTHSTSSSSGRRFHSSVKEMSHPLKHVRIDNTLIHPAGVLVFQRHSIWISASSPIILIETFCGFPQLTENAWSSIWIR
jgi:hypothetical protein